MKPFIIVGADGSNRGIALVRPWLTGEDAVKSFSGEEWGIYSAKIQPIESIPTITLATREWDVVKAFHTQHAA